MELLEPDALRGARPVLRGERNCEISDLPDKSSFLDLEPIRKKAAYLGRRIKRGLFRTGDGRLINADVNGAYNIIRKACPEAFKAGPTGVILHPVRLILEQPRTGARKKPQTPLGGNEGGVAAVRTHQLVLGLVN